LDRTVSPPEVEKKVVRTGIGSARRILIGPFAVEHRPGARLQGA
jgi:hypothetical protein